MNRKDPNEVLRGHVAAKNTSQRDADLCADYRDGKEIPELARIYDVGERRVDQILTEAGIEKRPRRRGKPKPISGLHVRIGLHLYTYLQDHGIELEEAAQDMGWTKIMISKVTRGVTKIELLELMDIAQYTQTRVSDLLKES